MRRIRAHVSLIGISSDWLFPPQDVRSLAERIQAAGVECDYTEFESAHGHDGFLAEVEAIASGGKPPRRCAESAGTREQLKQL